MNTMIYMIDTYHWDDYEQNERCDRTTMLFDNTADMNRQLADTLESLIPDRDMADDWNDIGDEYIVEPHYALGAYLSNLINKNDFVRFLKEQYRYPHNAQSRESWKEFGKDIRDIRWINFDCQDDTYNDFIKRMDELYPNVYMHEWKSHEDYERHEENAKRADQAVRMLQALAEYIRTCDINPFAKFNRSFKLTDTSRYTDTTTYITFTGLSGSHFNPEAFDTYNITIDEHNKALADAEYKRWLAYSQTPEGKAEEAKRIQRERDFQTAMYEGGYTSYARNDDGTITMWRD